MPGLIDKLFTGNPPQPSRADDLLLLHMKPVGEVRDFQPTKDSRRTCTLRDYFPEFIYLSVPEKELLISLWPGGEMAWINANEWYVEKARPACVQLHKKAMIVCAAMDEEHAAKERQHAAEYKIASAKRCEAQETMVAHQRRLAQLGT